MKEPVWVEKSVVLAIHQRQLAEHGGGDGVRDNGLLDSALERPKNRLIYGDPPPGLSEMAACYAYAIAKNHPFVDGNKRTAFVVCMIFLRINEKTISATSEEKYQTFLKLAEGTLGEAALASWIKAHIQDLEV
jgi:death on curing protein